MQDPVVDRIAAFLATAASAELPDAVLSAGKGFIADKLGVGIAGAVAPWRAEVLAALATGGAQEAVIWGSGERLPLLPAAMVNAYQVHCQEFDCVHEGAVVHPMAAILPTLLGWAERAGGVSGAHLLRAVIAGVEVAVTLGLCSRGPMRFFRPANCGGFGAVAGLSVLAGLDGDELRDALGIYYGQCAGTMQAHVEASPQLAMQMGFAARNALTAVELARRGMPGPRAPISGRFGYFALFDDPADPSPFDELGRRWRIGELSHKPFPSGRATHGGIDGVQRLMASHRIAADDVRAGRFQVPPLTFRLVGRPVRPDMSAAYARLCLAYAAAACLRRGTVGLGDFAPAALANTETLALASRLPVVEDGNPDPNALGPQRVEFDLADGRNLGCAVADVLGSPDNPLSRDRVQAKFAACWGSVPTLSPEQGRRLWDNALRLDTFDEVRELAGLLAPASR